MRPTQTQGPILLLGFPHLGSGPAYWVPANPTPASGDQFGWSVAASGNYVVVGVPKDDPSAIANAGRAYVFNVTTGALVSTLANPTPVAQDSFGGSVAISGNYAIVGANQDDTGGSDSGSAYMFDVTTGALVSTFANPAPAVSDLFGSSVAISGNYAIVGAFADDANGSDSGSAYIFN